MSAVSVVGLGKLGACVAAAMAHKGFDVTGVDVNETALAAVNAGQAPVHEPGLAEMMEANSGRLQATSNYQEAVLNTEVTFVIVPTPSGPDGGFSLEYVLAVGEALGAALRDKDAYHLVVLTSTVLPGATCEHLLPLLERASGKKCGTDFGLCYSPEFIALGSVLRDLLNPDMILIGESDERAGKALVDIYKRVVDADVPVQRMAIASAELTKISLNTFVTTKITFANMLAEMCERLPGGDVDAVTTALGLDSRVGKGYLTAGLGFGGPCFPRDNDALRFWSSTVGAPALLATSTHTLNRELSERLLTKVSERCGGKDTAVILGLSYKPGSPVLTDSAPLELATGLVERGISVIAYDPLSVAFQEGVIDARIELVDSLAEALARADVLVVANPDRAFADIRPEHFSTHPVVVFDCWRLLRGPLESAPELEYVAVGLAPEDSGTPSPLGVSAR